MIVFLTGYPGFIGRRIVLKLLEMGVCERIHVLIEKRLESYVRTLPEAKDLVCHQGDIRKPGLGLESPPTGITHLFHLAALYDLSTKREPAYEINVRGTQHVMEFAREHKVERVLYVSTAYVSGTREGDIHENELDMGQGFKNYYEETKFLAEKLVRDEFSDLRPTIIRPGIVVGSSQTGETAKFDGPYFILEALSRFPRWFPLPYIGKGRAHVNLVPVDYVVDGMVRLLLHEHTQGKTYHLTDPDPMKAREIYTLFNKLLRRVRPIGEIPPSLFRIMLKLPPLNGCVPEEALPYFDCDARYICTNAQEDIQWDVPPFEAYAPILVQFFLKNRKAMKVGPWEPPDKSE